jgi:hypothetical protein
VNVNEIWKAVWDSYGFVGLLLVLPYVAIVFLWRDNKSLRAENDKKDKDLITAKDQEVKAHKDRVDDQKNVTTILVDLNRAQAEVNKETALVLGDVRRLMERNVLRRASTATTPVK